MSLDIKGLDQLDRRFEQVLKDIPEARREMHARIGDVLREEVRGAIRTSGMKNSGGRVPGWQESYVGSKGGYAAVRAIPGAGPSGKAADSPGAITNYTESGHRTRGGGDYVEGYHFYRDVQTRAQSLALDEADRYADEITGRLGD